MNHHYLIFVIYIGRYFMSFTRWHRGIGALRVQRKQNQFILREKLWIERKM